MTWQILIIKNIKFCKRRNIDTSIRQKLLETRFYRSEKANFTKKSLKCKTNDKCINHPVGGRSSYCSNNHNKGTPEDCRFYQAFHENRAEPYDLQTREKETGNVLL